MDKVAQSDWASERDDILLGVAGAFLFGIPLLYTQEVWLVGSKMSPARLLLVLVATLAALVMLNRIAGFRRSHHVSIARSVFDSIESLAVGVFVAAVCLAVLNRITTGMSWEAIIGRISIMSVPFSVGVGIAGGLLKADKDGDPGDRKNSSVLRETGLQLGAAALGSTILTFAIAPTAETVILGAGLPVENLVALVVLSILATYIVFEAKFHGHELRSQRFGVFGHPFSETCASYVVALVVGALTLMLFDRFDDGMSLSQKLNVVVAIGLPATVGGSAGRMVL